LGMVVCTMYQARVTTVYITTKKFQPTRVRIRGLVHKTMGTKCSSLFRWTTLQSPLYPRP
jgi:hypothetical protein